MSSIGPATFAAQIASSVANTKRTDAHTAREATASEAHRMAAENEPAARAEDVGDPDLDGDRDPDGHRMWERSEQPTESPEEKEAARERRRNDSLDFLGGELDLEV